jgi:hypothetical protein
VEDERAEARRIREAFMDRPADKQIALHWEWPKTLYEIGECTGVMYSSDKWEPVPDAKYNDYKHIAEGPQLVCVKRGFLHDMETGRPMPIPSLKREVGGDMPSYIATLAPIIGIQVRLYEKRGSDYELPEEGNLYHVNVDRAKLGAARHPGTGQVFLVVFNEYDMPCIITGKDLDVTADGVVG